MHPGKLEALTLVILSVAACRAAPQNKRPMRRIVPVGHVELSAEPSDGVARKLRVTLVLQTPDTETLEVVGRRDPRAGGDDAVLELTLRTEDFPGNGPVSTGRTWTQRIEFGEDGSATPDDPLRRTYDLDLPGPGPALARRLAVRMRLFPVDLIQGEAHAGGLPVTLPAAMLETFHHCPAVDLDQALAGSDAAEIFLAAVTDPESKRPEGIRRIVQRLADVDRNEREALLAALLYLTGETHGRSVRLWQRWAESINEWKQER